MPRCLARNSGSRSAWLPPWRGVFLGSVPSLSEAGHLAASLMHRVRQDSEAVDVDCRQLVGRRLNDGALIMHLHEFAPVGRRASSGREWRRFERL